MESKLKNCRIPDIEFIEGGRSDKCVCLHEDYIYNFNRQRASIFYLRCHRSTCAATSLINVFDDGTGIFSSCKRHTHEPEYSYIKFLRFRRALKEEYLKRPNSSVAELYSDISARFGGPCGLTLASASSLLVRFRNSNFELCQSNTIDTSNEKKLFKVEPTDDCNHAEEVKAEFINTDNIEIVVSEDMEDVQFVDGDIDQSDEEHVSSDDIKPNTAEIVKPKERVYASGSKNEPSGIVITKMLGSSGDHVYTVEVSDVDEADEENVEYVEECFESYDEDESMEVENIKSEDIDDDCSSYHMDLKNCSIAGVKIIEGHRLGSTLLLHDDYMYVVKKRRKELAYVRCREKNCSGTGVIYLNEKGEGILRKIKKHNHPPDPDSINKVQFRSDLRSQCEDYPEEPSQTIFARVSAKHFGDNCNIKLKNVESLIARARKTGKSKHVIKEELEDDIFTDEYESNQYDTSDHSSHQVQSDNEINQSEEYSERRSCRKRRIPIKFANNEFEQGVLDSKLSVKTPEKLSPPEAKAKGSRLKRKRDEEDWELDPAHNDIGKYIRKCTIPGVEVLEGLRLGSLGIAFKNYVYFTKLRRGKKANLKCRVTSCSGTALILLKPNFKGEFMTMKGHTHPPDTEFINTLKFRKSVRLETIRHPNKSNKQIFDSVMSRFRREGRKCNVDFKAVAGLIMRSRGRSDEPMTDTDNSITQPKIPLKTSDSCSSDSEDNSAFADNADFGQQVVQSEEVVDDTGEFDNSSEENHTSKSEFSFIKRSKFQIPHIRSNYDALKKDVLNRNIPGVEKLEGFRRGGLILLYDNYSYIISIQRRNIVYMRCRIKGCRGTGVLQLVGDKDAVFNSGKPHSHPPDGSIADTLKFRHLLRTESIRNPMLSPREIFNKVSASFEGRIKEIPFSTVEGLMSRTRRFIKPPQLDSVLQLETIFKDPQWSALGTSYHMPKGQPWYRGSFTSRDGTKIAAFINECFCNTIHAFLPIVLHFDSSYDIDKQVIKNYHILSCHNVVNEKMFGFGFFLLNRRTAVAYKKCFDYLQTYTGPLEPTLVYTDYDLSLQTAVRATWPISTTRGCYYHFVQSLVKKCKEDNQDLPLKPNKKMILKFYLSLALLPHEHIIAAHIVINHMINEDQELIDSFWQLNDYFCLFWLDKVGPQQFSIYEKPNKLNDSVELFHSRMKHGLGYQKTFWTFIDALRVLSHNEEADYLACINESKIPSKKVMHMQQDKAVASAIKTFVSGLRFVSRMEEDNKEEALTSVLTSFLDGAASALEGLLDRELQDPKESKVTRPKRILIATAAEELNIPQPDEPIEELILQEGCEEETFIEEPYIEETCIEETPVEETIEEVTHVEFDGQELEVGESAEIIVKVENGMLIKGENDIIEIDKDKISSSLLKILDHDYSYEMIIQDEED